MEIVLINFALVYARAVSGDASAASQPLGLAGIHWPCTDVLLGRSGRVLKAGRQFGLGRDPAIQAHVQQPAATCVAPRVAVDAVAQGRGRLLSKVGLG
jgi:hypothetical protein